MQVNNLGACGGGSGEGGGAGGGSSGCQTLDAKLLANDIARQTRVPHELQAQMQLLMGNFTGNNCDVNEITRARVWSAAGSPAGDW